MAVVLGLGALLPIAGPASATVFTNNTAINIPPPQGAFYTPGTPYPSGIAVSGLSGTVTDVNVTLCGLSATFPSDVDIMLVAPNGTTGAVIMSDVGGNGEEPGIDPVNGDQPVNNLNITLDDSAAAPPTKDGQLLAGTFKPFDDDVDEFDLNSINTDVFNSPAPLATDRVGVYRPSSGTWFFRNDTDNTNLSAFNGVSPNGTWNLFMMDDIAASAGDGETVLPTLSCGWSIDVIGGGSGIPHGNGTAVGWGTSGDVPVPGDYDGNGSPDIAVYRPSQGLWFIQGGATVAWGTAGDIPVPGDYDGDGDTDLAVFRPSNGIWFVNGGVTVPFGTNGDIPVPVDYNNDDQTDIAVFRPSSGTWLIQTPSSIVAWGTNGDIPVPGDFDRNGSANRAVWRPAQGIWFIQNAGTIVFGTTGDIPVQNDYNNDGFIDVAVFRPSTGTWFIQGQTPFAFGTNGDIPLPLSPVNKTVFFPVKGIRIAAE